MLLVFAGAPAAGQPVTSPGPDSVAVTIYRAPYRHPSRPINPRWIEGYALVTEQRTVTIPAGRAVIRFEGVAAGVLPESAIVTGLPDGVREKNLDADLLSPYSLYARSYGRPITIRRTSAEGKVREERAVIRSGPTGAAILETKDGFLAADCRAPGADALIYDSVPEGLSAKPTLSVETEAARGGQVTLTLSYLAWGFDWQADYVATMRPDGRSADLFAWVTLANGDVTGFADAQTMVVAGNVRREERSGRQAVPETPPLLFQCLATPYYDDKIVDGIRSEDIGAFPDTNLAEAVQRVPGVAMSRKGMVDQVIAEDFGDLKLYRVPRRTTVAAMSQKQVALLDKPSVPVEVFYRSWLNDDEVPQDPMLMIRAKNKLDKGLGLALPAGRVAVFEPQHGVPLLIGEGDITDKAVGEDVEVEVSDTSQVNIDIEEVASGARWADHVVTVTNANPWPIRFETHLSVSDDYRRTRISARTVRKPGGEYWIADVPANGSATLRFRLVERR